MHADPTPDDDGPVVYFIQPEQGGPIKIGYSSRRSAVPGRLAMLQTGNPYRLVIRKVIDAPGWRGTEGDLHEKFAQYRLAGEWFLDMPAVVAEADADPAAWATEGRLLEPLVRNAFEAGRVQGEQEAEVRIRLLLKKFFDLTLPWLFGEEDDMRSDPELCSVELAIEQIVNRFEMSQIRTEHAELLRERASQGLQDGLSLVRSGADQQ